MKTAKFEMLGIELPLGKRQSFTDEGFVSSLMDKVEELSETYTNNFYSLLMAWQLLDVELPRGACLPFYEGRWPFRNVHVHIMYEDLGCDVKRIGVRGHEETHALYRLNGLRYLEERMQEAGIKTTKRLRKMPGENMADVGGFYALRRQGFSLEQIKKDSDEHALDTIARFINL